MYRAYLIEDYKMYSSSKCMGIYMGASLNNNDYGFPLFQRRMAKDLYTNNDYYMMPI